MNKDKKTSATDRARREARKRAAGLHETIAHHDCRCYILDDTEISKSMPWACRMSGETLSSGDTNLFS